MKKTLLGFALILLAVAGCKKEDSKTPSSGGTTNTTGEIALINSSKNGYDVTKDGTGFATVAGAATQQISLEAGTYQFVATQKEGFVFSPTVVKKTIEIRAGSKALFTFP